MQDYHLTLAPRMLTELTDGRGPAARIAHFSHTPWAPVDYFRLLPDAVAAEVLDGILGADHAGFLCGRWADAFVDCCEQVLGAAGAGVTMITHGEQIKIPSESLLRFQLAQPFMITLAKGSE